MTQLDELEKLHDLKEKGILSEEEFDNQKKALLEQNVAGNEQKMVSMTDAYVSYWKKSFVWSGRATRAEYWWPVLVNFLINLVSMIVTVFVPFFGILFGLFGIVTIFPGFAVLARRMHDVNKSAWFGVMPILLLFGLTVSAIVGNTGVQSEFDGFKAIVLIIGYLIAFVMGIIVFIYTLLPGTKGKNKYGDAR